MGARNATGRVSDAPMRCVHSLGCTRGATRGRDARVAYTGPRTMRSFLHVPREDGVAYQCHHRVPEGDRRASGPWCIGGHAFPHGGFCKPFIACMVGVVCTHMYPKERQGCPFLGKGALSKGHHARAPSHQRACKDLDEPYDCYSRRPTGVRVIGQVAYQTPLGMNNHGSPHTRSLQCPLVARPRIEGACACQGVGTLWCDKTFMHCATVAYQGRHSVSRRLWETGPRGWTHAIVSGSWNAADL